MTRPLPRDVSSGAGIHHGRREWRGQLCRVPWQRQPPKSPQKAGHFLKKLPVSLKGSWSSLEAAVTAAVGAKNLGKGLFCVCVHLCLKSYPGSPCRAPASKKKKKKQHSGLFMIEIVATMFARKRRLLPWLSRLVYTDGLKAA